jgi:hypothetical protein
VQADKKVEWFVVLVKPLHLVAKVGLRSTTGRAGVTVDALDPALREDDYGGSGKGTLLEDFIRDPPHKRGLFAAGDGAGVILIDTDVTESVPLIK